MEDICAKAHNILAAAGSTATDIWPWSPGRSPRIPQFSELYGGRKGAIVTLSVLAAVLIIWTSIWYFGYAIHYDRLAKPLEKVSDPVAAMTTAGHTLEVGVIVP